MSTRAVKDDSVDKIDDENKANNSVNDDKSKDCDNEVVGRNS